MKMTAFFSLLVLLLNSAQAAPGEDTASEVKWRKYYSEHLPEAEKMLEACVAKGFGKLQGEELIKCNNARDAWHFQPYKPKSPTFSSSGGRK